jgi:hypothetical protein
VNWVRLLHAIGLTNLTDEQLARCTSRASQPPVDLADDNTLQADSVVAIDQLQSVFSEFIVSYDLRRTMTELGTVLPIVIRQQALNSRRSVPDIVHDLFDRMIEALEINWRRTAELRLEQGSGRLTEVWVAAYPFLDHVDETHKGMYETVRKNLCDGAKYVYFQPDRKYFDILRAKLARDAIVAAARVVLDERLHFIDTDPKLLRLATFSVWNPQEPRQMEVLVLPHHQNPIQLVDESGVSRVASNVTMLKVSNRAQAEVLYEQLEPLYKQAMEQSGGERTRRGAGA